VKQLHNVGLTKIAVFYQNDAYGKAGLDGVTLALAALNLKPIAVATVERNSVDVAKAVETINAALPEAVVQISAYKSCAAYIRTARKAGYGGGFYNVSFVGTQALADELGKEGAGVVVSQVVPSPYTGIKPISREFAEAVRKSNGAVQANFSSMEGYIAARVLAEGLRRAGGRGGVEGLISAMESINGQPFGGFNVNFSRTDHAASSFVELSMLTGDGRVRT
jgi:branched-chain amino acid transport system substrate-binding protein